MEFTGERFIPTVNDTNDEIKIEHLQRYDAIKELVTNKRVLDAACGEGYGTDMLATYASQAFGLDIDKKTIQHAQQVYKKDNLEYLVGSVEKLPFEDNYFDMVVSFETIEHVDETIQRKFLTEIKRVLKSGGQLIISTPNKKIYSDLRNYSNPFHVKEFYKEEFNEFLKESFTNVELYYQYRESSFLLTGANSKTISNLNYGEIAERSKYIVAICSDVNIPTYKIESAVIENDVLSQKINRIVALQYEVEERNNHIKNLNREIKHRDNTLNVMKQEVLDKEHNLNMTIKELKENEQKQEARIQELKENDQEQENRIQSLKMKIQHQEGELEQLKAKERELNNIYDSDGWKLLLKYYRIRDKIIAPNGKLRFLAKMSKRVIIDRNFKLVNKDNIKKFFYYYKNQNLSMLENKIDNYIERNNNTVNNTPLAIEEIGQVYEKLIFKKYENPKVSIIIPVYNQWHYTYACLKSILAHTKNISYEVILADDMSSDETLSATKYAENIKVVRDGNNRGFLLNCNNAAQFANGEFIYFLNNDTQVQEQWLETLVDLMESDKSIGMAGSKLVYPDGRLQEAGGIIWNDASGWNYGRLDDPNKPEYNYVKEVDYISGAGIIVRKTLWQQIGGFDERYVPAYYEDTDLAFEVRKQGYKVVLNPKSVVVHFEGISHGKDENSKAQAYQKKNKELFLKKWKTELETFHFNNSENVFLARDRSKDKKVIVVVDHYVPHYDRDAGGRCTYSYLNLFVNLGYKVIFIGDNYYRHEPYTTDLQQKGIEVFYGNDYAQNIEQWFKNNANYIDYVYLNRPHISIKYIDLVKKHTKAKVVYFGHDLHYLRELRNYEIDKNPELLRSSEKWKKIEFEIFNKADVVHVVGSYEQEVLETELQTKPVRNIPLYMYSKADFKVLDLNFEERKDVLFVGGFNHKPNYDGVLWFVNEVFPQILQNNPGIKFYIVGSNPPEDIVNLQSENIVVTGYVSDEELEQHYKQCRVVVVPLRYGAGVKGKVVEALYNYVPIVTTPIGSEGLTNVEESVLVAKDHTQFSEMVNELYNNESQWNTLARNSEIYIKEHFSFEAAVHQVKQDMN